MTNETQQPGPYKGPLPFAIGDKLFGRKQEVFDLLNRLMTDRVVILCSPSGAGKTSLLNAGLLPALERRGFVVPKPLRPGAEPSAQFGGNRYLLATLNGLYPQRTAEANFEAIHGASKVFDYLESNTQLSLEDEGVVLIFDQFEEVLSRDPTDIDRKQEFFAKVGELIRRSSESGPWLVVFSMREEFLASLDPYRHHFANGLNSRYRLELLNRSEAKQAIQGPATALKVEYEADALDCLANELSQVQVQDQDGHSTVKQGNVIEPVQLQVVCTRLWQEWRSANPQAERIELEDVKKYGNVERALSEFYRDSVSRVAEKTRVSEREIREFVDGHLITENGLRGQVQLGPGATKGLPNEAIWGLVDTYLIRADKRHSITWLELAHDRLLAPVRANNTTWFKESLNTTQLQAKLWNERNRPPGLLLSGESWAEAERWALQPGVKLKKDEEEFIAACRAAAQIELLKIATGVILLLLCCVSIGLAIYSFRLSQLLQVKEANERRARFYWENKAMRPLQENVELKRISDQLKFEAESKVANPDLLRGGAVATFLNRWPEGSAVRLQFKDGDPAIQDKIKWVAQEWTLFANLKFEFLPGGDIDAKPDVRIGMSRPGSWSMLGKDALKIPANSSAMNFGDFKENTPDSEYRRVVLHEFGHLLGLVHELQSPNSKVEWDRPAVYAYFQQSQGWSRSMIDQNILKRYNDPKGQYREFDRNSIMTWPVPASLTLNAMKIDAKSDLSRSDRNFIALVYPFTEVPRKLAVGGSPLTFEPQRLELQRFAFTIDSEGKYKIEFSGPAGAELVLTAAADLTKTDPPLLIRRKPSASNSVNIEQTLSPGSYHVLVRYFATPAAGAASVSAKASPE